MEAEERAFTEESATVGETGRCAGTDCMAGGPGKVCEMRRDGLRRGPPRETACDAHRDKGRAQRTSGSSLRKAVPCARAMNIAQTSFRPGISEMSSRLPCSNQRKSWAVRCTRALHIAQPLPGFGCPCDCASFWFNNFEREKL